MKYIVVLLFLLAGLGICSWRLPNLGTDNLYVMVMNNSPEISMQSISLSDSNNFKSLQPLDTVFLQPLAKYELLAGNDYEDLGCHNQLYYYGHAKIDSNYTVAVFAQSVCSCCGDDELILAVIDRKGNMTAAMVVAERMNASECTYYVNATLKQRQLVVADKNDCSITDGPKAGYTEIDSTTNFYTITTTGKLKAGKKLTNKMVR